MKTARTPWLVMARMGLVVAGAGGCTGGDARVEIAAANLLDVTAEALEQTLNEYHAQMQDDDDRRRHAALLAFADRLNPDPDPDPDPDTPAREDAMRWHTEQFEAALAKLRENERTERVRYATAIENVNTLRRAAGALRDLAVASLSLEDETKRYLTDALVGVQQVRARREAIGERNRAVARPTRRTQPAAGGTDARTR